QNMTVLACFLLASCLLWLASGLLCPACVLPPFGRCAPQAWWFVRDLVDEVPLSLYRVEDQIQRTAPLSFTANGRVHFVRFLEHGLKG
ncbi:MAG: hypothetical protein ACPF8U_08645, partial [Flavobacteriales bacterium]